ncbi:hypothetical protein [uncultured Methanobrevibacter sp.]|nr:hypothetical protein [uncultured Methanobrevibacter sp.]
MVQELLHAITATIVTVRNLASVLNTEKLAILNCLFNRIKASIISK